VTSPGGDLVHSLPGERPLQVRVQQFNWEDVGARQGPATSNSEVDVELYDRVSDVHGRRRARRNSVLDDAVGTTRVASGGAVVDVSPCRGSQAILGARGRQASTDAISAE
jgi:hypothetical protein